jgi:hypothetical protein
MRRLPIALALAMTLVLALTVASAMAATKNQPAGDRISLFDGDQSFPASTAFHVDHGFLFENGVVEKAIGKASFALDVDGAPQKFDFAQVTHPDGFQLSKLWFYNFPAGMTGSHIFTGHWYQACDNDTIPCNGSRMNTVVEVLTETISVDFS